MNNVQFEDCEDVQLPEKVFQNSYPPCTKLSKFLFSKYNQPIHIFDRLSPW